ncbi:hypothetical protein ACIBHY_54055 [Nonomuraea sp. NPDC050547]|uniref:hypothetical protein n=1 Tax=Nonomuraea sp. NPDC050547 TaxID=3364368 RepID=UPI00379EC03D
MTVLGERVGAAQNGPGLLGVGPRAAQNGAGSAASCSRRTPRRVREPTRTV